MQITNIRKDGSIISDLSEIVIRERDFPALYALIRAMTGKEENDEEVAHVCHESRVAQSA